MTNEQKFELIKSYIDDIKIMQEKEDLTINEKQHLSRALAEYTSLFEEAQRGRIDPDFLHENITSYLYMLQ